MALQEEVEQRTVTLIVNTAKLTERELQKAISKLLIQMKAERQHKSPKVKLRENEVCSVYEADLPETTEAPDEAIPQN